MSVNYQTVLFLSLSRCPCLMTAPVHLKLSPFLWSAMVMAKVLGGAEASLPGESDLADGRLAESATPAS